MTKDRDELIEMLGMGVSRRKMLQRMGLGLAGAAVAPTLIENAWGATTQRHRSPGVSLSDSTPQPVWTYNAPSSYSFADNPLYYNGTLIIVAFDNDQGNGLIYSLDSQTKEVRWSHAFPGINFFTPLAANGVIFVSGFTNGGAFLYAIDPSTGNVLWQKSYAIPTELKLIDNKLIFPTGHGRFIALELQGNLVWS